MCARPQGFEPPAPFAHHKQGAELGNEAAEHKSALSGMLVLQEDD